MVNIKPHFDLYAKFISTEKGYGVFSNEFIPKNSIIETIYCVPVSPNEQWSEYTTIVIFIISDGEKLVIG
jgi:hypothetical protein